MASKPAGVEGISGDAERKESGRCREHYAGYRVRRKSVLSKSDFLRHYGTRAGTLAEEPNYKEGAVKDRVPDHGKLDVLQAPGAYVDDGTMHTDETKR